MGVKKWEAGLIIPNAPRTGEKKADRDAGLKATTPCDIACACVVIGCTRVVRKFAHAHTFPTPPPPQAKAAACDNPQSLSWGQMNESTSQTLKHVERSGPQRWPAIVLHCRKVNEPDGGGLTPLPAQPVGHTAASVSATSPQLPIKRRPTVALEDPTSLDTNAEEGLEELAPEEEMTAPMPEAPPRPPGMTVIQRGRRLRIHAFGARYMFLEPVASAQGRQGGRTRSSTPRQGGAKGLPPVEKVSLADGLRER